MIRAVTLDFWNTLMNDFHLPTRDELRAARLLEIVGPYGYAPDEYEIEAAFAEAWRHFDAVWYKKARTPTTAESTAVILRSLRIKLPDEARQRVVTMLEEIILEHPPRLVPGVAETLPVLAERYALAVVSDAAMTPRPRPAPGARRLRPRAVVRRLLSRRAQLVQTRPAGLSHTAHGAGHRARRGRPRRRHPAHRHRQHPGRRLKAVLFVGINAADRQTSSADAVVTHFADLPAAVAELG